MKRKTTKRTIALTLCAILASVPLLGLAAPAVEAGTLECSLSGSAVTARAAGPAEGESAPPQTEPPKPQEPAEPSCLCETRCVGETGNGDCPVCRDDSTKCQGKEPEPASPLKPSYTITITAPKGWHTKTAQVEIRLTDDNGTGWKKAEAKVERGGSWMDLTDQLAHGNRATVEISENCTVYVTVTDKDGKAHTKSRYMECFDRTPPTVKAGTDRKLLRVEADDEDSGVAAVYIDGDRYDDLTNGTLDVRLRDLDDRYKQISIQAVDYAGNRSKTVQLANPNYEEPKKDKDKEKPSADCPDAPKPETTPGPADPEPTPPAPPADTPDKGGAAKPSTGSAPASGGKPGTTASTSGTGGREDRPVEKEPGEPLSEGSAIVTRDLLYDKATNKQFITVQGRDGGTFYIVIDYDAPVNEAEEQFTTYFLNQVDEADLAALLGEETPAACTCKDKCQAGAVNTSCPVCSVNMTECAGKEPEPEQPQQPEPAKQEPEQPEQEGAAPVGLMLALALALAGGGAFYYFKFLKNKPRTKGSADLEDYDYGEEDLDEDGLEPDDLEPDHQEPEEPELDEEEPDDGEDEDL